MQQEMFKIKPVMKFTLTDTRRNSRKKVTF